MHLRSLRIRGFKSFPDTLEISLEPGVAVIVGPNGSGKSNIADAIVWAAGSLTPSELRAEKPDDVLFAGGGDRKAADALRGRARLRQRGRHLARSRLLGGLDRAAARTRRRGPVPRQPGRGPAYRPRRDSLGRRARLCDALDRRPGQGRAGARVQAGGSSRVRRGGGRAREVQAPAASRRAEARARRAPGRARPRRRGGGAQAPAAARAPGHGRGARREARTARSRVCARGSRSSIWPTRARVARRPRGVATPLTFSKRGAQGRLEGVLADRARAEEELSDAAGRREAAVAARYRLQSGMERLELRMRVGLGARRAVRRRDACRATSPKRRASSRVSSSMRHERPKAARSAERERIALAERAALVRERVRALEQALAEQEGLPPAARALAEDGASVWPWPRSTSSRVRSGRSRPRFGSRAAAVIADDPAVGLALLQRARAAGLGSLTVLAGRSPQDLVGEFPVVTLDALLDVDGAFGHARRLRLRPRHAASCGSWGRPPRPCCSSCRAGARRSLRRRPRSDEEVATATRGRRGGGRARSSSGGRVRAGTEAAERATIDAATLEPARRPGDGAPSTASTRRSEPPAASRRRFVRASTPERCGRASSARSCGRSARPR